MAIKTFKGRPEQFHAWVLDLKDLQKPLSDDLTIKGIDAVKELIGKTEAQGHEVQHTLDEVIAELGAIAASAEQYFRDLRGARPSLGLDCSISAHRGPHL